MPNGQKESDLSFIEHKEFFFNSLRKICLRLWPALGQILQQFHINEYYKIMQLRWEKDERRKDESNVTWNIWNNKQATMNMTGSL